jgi:hypothetical protein
MWYHHAAILFGYFVTNDAKEVMQKIYTKSKYVAKRKKCKKIRAALQLH